MGKATMDLPDLLQESAKSGNAGTDDLLAQMAGEEIDRLLADADVERSDSAAAPKGAEPVQKAATAQAPVAPIAPSEPAAVADSVLQSIAAPALNDSQAEITPPQPAEKLLPELDDPLGASVLPPEVEAPLDPELEEATRESTDPTERMGLDLALGNAAAQLEAEGDAAIGNENALPIYLRPFDWLNGVFSRIPETALDVSGKIAILTMVNAIAVLLYVLFFRHH